jgi:hypothetical protein
MLLQVPMGWFASTDTHCLQTLQLTTVICESEATTQQIRVQTRFESHKLVSDIVVHVHPANKQTRLHDDGIPRVKRAAPVAS